MAELKLDSHHRATLEQVFRHPLSHNLQWHDVLSLLEAIGTVDERKPDHYVVRIGSVAQTLDIPQAHDMTAEQVMGVRHLLQKAGYAPQEHSAG
jgi:hypothetical protein